uniref:Metalloendopeptidase n=1 Tax=Strongyloides papillosus TaxID=174720 RepID=A0A0N5BQ37_STREA
MIFIIILIFLSNLVFFIDSTNFVLGNNLSNDREKRAVLRRKNYLWREKEIVVHISSMLNENVVKLALYRISMETCLKFLLTRNPKKAIFIYQPGKYHETVLGRRKVIPQRINLPMGKEEVGKTMRETLRALGFDYEHNRNDRDKFISINETFIIPEFLKYFRKNYKGSANTYGFGYDYRSLMHFKENEYGIASRIVITAHNNYMQLLMGKSERLTFNDAKLVNKVYCSNLTTVFPPRCYNYGYQHPKHKSSMCLCPPFVHGTNCQSWLSNHKFCTINNRFVATRKKTTIYPRVAGKCTFYISSSYGSKIMVKLGFDKVRPHTFICKENNSVEIRFQKDLSVSGILFCPGNYPLKILSQGNLVIIQSNLPEVTMRLKIKYWQYSD